MTKLDDRDCAKKLGIIPTPQQVRCDFQQESDKLSEMRTVRVMPDISGGLRISLAMLDKHLGRRLGEETTEQSNLVITSDPALLPHNWLTSDDLAMFEKEDAEEQGYIIKRGEDMPIVIAAKSELGCMYGISTLIQILDVSVAEFLIRDWPDIRFRANNWVIFSEIGIWSYDFGDGMAAFKERIIRKLDTSLKYKINMIYFDGFGFDAERYPEYKSLMQDLCREARLRGIYLLSGGYGMAYGLVGFRENLYQGKFYMNRKNYPDGEIYPCIGTYIVTDVKPDDGDSANGGDLNNPFGRYDPERGPDEKLARHIALIRGREYGTCLSNNVLLDEKLKELTDYVRKTEIGGLYIHSMDAHEMHEPLWLSRCPACRERWPNDDLNARDGAAGAFANFFDELSRKLRSVRTDRYNAAEDLLIFYCSPGYMYESSTDDASFEKGRRFWSRISEYMTEKRNVFPMFRENFYNHDDNRRRTEELSREWKSDGFGILNFTGADGDSSDKLFIMTAALYYLMREAKAVICANGNSYQEPLQLMNAEYMWNLHNSAFYNVENKPENYRSFVELYHGYRSTEIRPEGIYGKGGFLDAACIKLYGERAGAKMADVYRLHGKNYETAIPTACNVEIYTQHNKSNFQMRWDNQLAKQEIADTTERFDQSHAVTESAYKIVASIISNKEYTADTESDLKWFRDSLDMGTHLTEYLARYMHFFHRVDDLFDDGKTPAEDLEKELGRLSNEVEEYRSHLDGLNIKPFDLLGGAMVWRDHMMDFLLYNIGLMISSIQTNKRIPDNRRELVKAGGW